MQSVSVQVLRSVLEYQNKNSDILCVDVRNPDEYTEEHIAGVINIPLPELGMHRNEFAVKKEIYVHCKSGVRSQKACEEMEKMGILASIFHVDGGILAWQRQGLPLV